MTGTREQCEQRQYFRRSARTGYSQGTLFKDWEPGRKKNAEEEKEPKKRKNAAMKDNSKEKVFEDVKLTVRNGAWWRDGRGTPPPQ